MPHLDGHPTRRIAYVQSLGTRIIGTPDECAGAVAPAGGDGEPHRTGCGHPHTSGGGMTLPSDLFGVLAEAAARHGERDYLIVGRRAEVIGFAELARRAELFGRVLTAHGVCPGDRVALWMTNQVDWAVAAYGIARCGAVLVGVNTRLTGREVAHMIGLSRPKLWILEANFLGKVPAADAVAPVLAELSAQGIELPLVMLRGPARDGMLDFAAAQRQAAALPPLPPTAELVARIGEGEFPELAGVAAILSTSGTTAAPKGVMLGHA